MNVAIRELRELGGKDEMPFVDRMLDTSRLLSMRCEINGIVFDVSERDGDLEVRIENGPLLIRPMGGNCVQFVAQEPAA